VASAAIQARLIKTRRGSSLRPGLLEFADQARWHKVGANAASVERYVKTVIDLDLEAQHPQYPQAGRIRQLVDRNLHSGPSG
jgi:hypothetical protein